MAGLTAARALSDAGRTVHVVEKSRGLGGRLATRRTREGWTFDHGAQFAKGHDAEFAAYLSQARDQGAAADWVSEGHHLPVGLPGMSGLVAPLAAGIDVQFGATVTTLERTDEGWSVTGDGMDGLTAGAVIIAIPPAQASALVKPVAPEIADRLAGVEVDACLAAMIAFDDLVTALPDLMRDPTDDLQWVVRESAKPGRADRPERFTVHASVDWSRRHLEREKDEIGRLLAGLLRDLIATRGGQMPEPIRVMGHRWRYARTRTPLGSAFAVSTCNTLFAGGDWALGDRVEAAFLSGRAMSHALGASD